MVKRHKNRNGQGSISKRKDGRYVGRKTMGRQDTGKPYVKCFYGQTPEEVQEKMAKYIINPQENNDELKNQPLRVLMKPWLLTFKKSGVTPRTFRGNMTNYSLHIEKQIGNYALKNVTSIVCQDLFNKMLDEYNVNTVTKVKSLLNQFFEYCVREGIVRKNVIKNTVLKTKEKGEYKDGSEDKTIPLEGLQKLFSVLPSNPLLNVICDTALSTGGRLGELLALKWNDLLCEDGNWKVRYDTATTTTMDFDENGHPYNIRTIEANTKTENSARSVSVSARVINLLMQYKEVRKKVGEEQGVDLTSPTSYIFGYDDGRLRTARSIQLRLERFVKSHGLEGYNIHFHAFRQTYSNTQLESRVNPRIVQQEMGHKNMSTTVTNYSSITSDYQKASVSAIEGLFNQINESVN